MRALTLAVLVAGAAASLILMLRAAHPPLLLRLMFIVWLLSPFAALLYAGFATDKRSVYIVSLLITAAAVAMYAGIIPMPAQTRPAFRFIAVPFVSWIAIVVAALSARRKAA